MTRMGLVAASVCWCVASVAAAGTKRPGLCETAAGTEPGPPYVGVFSAFPAELVPLLAAAEIDDTVEIHGRRFFLGRLGGVNVVLSLLGIGMVNARESTARLLAHFEIAGIVVSGVAGSQHNIGDVVVARSWVETGRQRVAGERGAGGARRTRGDPPARALRDLYARAADRSGGPARLHAAHARAVGG